MGDWYYINCCSGKCKIADYDTPESAVLSMMGDDMWMCEERHCTNRHTVLHKTEYTPGIKVSKPAGIEDWDDLFWKFAKRYAIEHHLKGTWSRSTWGDYHWQACQAMAVEMYGKRPRNATAYDIIDRG